MTLIRFIDRVLSRTLEAICSLLLVSMVGFIIYTVVLRTVFLAPPFWGDTLTLFANTWLVMLAFVLAVRTRGNIAMTTAHAFLPTSVTRFLEGLWIALFGALGLLLLVKGWEVVGRIPGSYWELGNLPKAYPMTILPIAGVLVMAASAMAMIDHFRDRDGRRTDEDDAKDH